MSFSSDQTKIAFSDSPSIDAFARARVSNPETLFDSKQLYDSQPLLWDDAEQSGGSTTTTYNTNKSSTTIAVANTTAGRRVRQTFQRFNYQPGKSQLLFLTGTLTTASGAGITRSMGLYDDNNGFFFQDDEGTIKAVKRSYITGAAVDTKVAQADWNLDKLDGTGASSVTLDPTASQIMILDMEWLGVGRVRMGFVFDGIPVYCHEFLHANVAAGVYMTTPNLPLRYEIENDGTGGAASLECICGSVISEGGVQDNGVVRYSSTANTQIDCAVVGTIYAVKGLRLKTTHLSATVKILTTSLTLQSTSDDVEWLLIFDPTYGATPTWGNETNSAVQSFTGAGTETVTGGTIITGGYVSTGTAVSGAGSIAFEIPNALLLGSKIDGTQQSIALCARSLTATNALVEGAITWRELL
jgi:hypothetical protein